MRRGITGGWGVDGGRRRQPQVHLVGLESVRLSWSADDLALWLNGDSDAGVVKGGVV